MVSVVNQLADATWPRDDFVTGTSLTPPAAHRWRSSQTQTSHQSAR